MSDKRNAPKTFDQLAEFHVAGLFAEEGWDVYFPHRDRGFDFVIIKRIEGKFVIRPVQVKGKYPEKNKKEHKYYGFIGRLTQHDPEMVLAIPYFERGDLPLIKHVAFMPACKLSPHSRGYRCEPAKFKGGAAEPRRDHQNFFGHEGLRRVANPDWSQKNGGD